jgi:crotonobetainyl-CoA:carnitine CoA-transferase CaiB-like acyl-CoA transferase
MIQGLSGIMSVTGEKDTPPTKVGVPVVDLMTGMYAAVGMLAALVHRTHSHPPCQSSPFPPSPAPDQGQAPLQSQRQEGAFYPHHPSRAEGTYIDMSLLDVAMAFLSNQASNYLISGVQAERVGNAHPNIAPYQSVRTNDGHMIVAVGNDTQFARFCEALGRAELAMDERFHRNPSRLVHRHALAQMIEEVTTTRPTAHWLAVLHRAGVPASLINDIPQALADPQVTHRRLVHFLPHPYLAPTATVPLMSCPIKFYSEFPSEPAPPTRTCGDGSYPIPAASQPNQADSSQDETSPDQPPPVLGQHTEQVLRELLHMSPPDIAALRRAGII